jgi:hypothetical protein
MGTITSEQLTALADQFNTIAAALEDYRENNALPDEESQQLEQLESQLSDGAVKLATQSAIETADEASAALNSLAGINTLIGQTIKGLQDVQQAITIAASAVQVASSVISMNPGQIVNAVGGLANACNIHL